jgi:D-alanyl-D-alanine carboxypeptidase
MSMLRAKLQLILDEGTLEGVGMGLQLGVVTPVETLELASGFAYLNVKDPTNYIRAKPSDLFLMGSTTKMYTAAAVLRLVQEGHFGLDDKALPLMDSLFRKLSGTGGASIVDFLGQSMHNVTVRQLLNMRSGIPDFDDKASREFQLQHPEVDMGPVQEISFCPSPSHSNSCEPGACAQYSSTNYEILGVILAQHANASSWDMYNQSLSIPADLLQELHHTKFALHGTCKEYGTVHGVTIDAWPNKLPSDVYAMSCTNGWTCGNLLSSAGDAARFVKALLGPGERVLSADLQRKMLAVSGLTQGWQVGLPYGLGTMDFSRSLNLTDGTIVGHGGATYGFLSFTGYMKDIDVGFSIVANIEDPVIRRVARAAVHAVRAHFQAQTTTVLV